jgi:putative transposase
MKRTPNPNSLFAGVDLGINCYAVLADENGQELERIAPLKPLRTEIRKLRRASRSHSRKKKGSSGRRKSAQKLGRIHTGIANRRSNFLHQTSSHLVKTQDQLVIEDLAPSNLVRNRTLSREISDASWGAFKTMLEYKSSWKGVELVVAPRNFPSSKTCSGCGVMKTQLSLSEREFVCESCGLKTDRDTNAAVNLAKYGRAIKQAAAGCAEALNAGGVRSSGRAGPSRRCETTCGETGTILVERSAEMRQPRRLPSQR